MTRILEPSWNRILKGEFTEPYFIDLMAKVDLAYQTQEVWPKKSAIFSAFEKCPFEKVKVVILGQDPYPTPGHANGLAFSLSKEVKPFAKSLINIFKEIESDLGIASPVDGDLTRWAEQGVFLLNPILTVQAGQAHSHKNIGWLKFTDQVIQKISAEKKGVVFLLWGNQAQKKAQLIDSSKHFILQSVHPSPLSAYRGFFGCKHFRKANELLISQKLSPINW